MKNILITANGSMSTEAVVDSLKDKYNLVGTNIYANNWVGTSHLFNKTYQVPKANNKNYIDKILEICINEKIDYIIPLTDVEIDILSSYRDIFENKNIKICISNDYCIKYARNKKLFYELFKQNEDILVIPTYWYDELENVDFKDKIIAKPYNGRSSEKQYIFSGMNEIDTYIKNKNEYIFQPFFNNGSIFVIDYVRDFCGNDFAVSREELLRTKNGAGTTVKIEANEQLLDFAHIIGVRLQVIGAINIEFIKYNNKYYLMDINPRFSAGIEYTKLIGYDIVTSHLNCFQQKEILKPIIIKPTNAVKRYITYLV